MWRAFFAHYTTEHAEEGDSNIYGRDPGEVAVVVQRR